MGNRSWNQIEVYDNILLAEKRRPKGLIEAAFETDNDPVRLAVSAPERGGANIGGFKVDSNVEEAMRRLIDRGLRGYRTKADICRTAVTHFVMDQVLPALDSDHGKRFESYRNLLQAKQEENTISYQTDALRAAETLYTLGTLKNRQDLMDRAFYELKAFLRSYYSDEAEFPNVRDMFYKSHVFGEAFKAFYERPEPPDPEQIEFEREIARQEELERKYGQETDPALEALAAEQDEERNR